VVPLTDAGGKIHGLQFLRTAAQAKQGHRPAKEFWPPGIAKKGHFHLLGHQPHWIVLLAEGYATAATLHEATGYPVVCAFDAGNLVPVAEALRKRYKRAKILVCADDDSLGKCGRSECRARLVLEENPVDCPSCGEPHGYTNAGVEGASAAAMTVGGEWIAPQFSDQAGRISRYLAEGAKDTDFNDLQHCETQGAVGAQVSERIEALRWAPPQLRAVPTPAEGGGALRPIQYLDDLLGRYALVYASGGAVFDKQQHCLLPLTDMRNICIRSDLHKAWMEHPDRHIVRQDEVGFDPACADHSISCNLWGGWPTQPKSGSCERILDLLQYLCSGERNRRELYQWVLRWCAYPIQHPGAKMKSTVVLHGGQGAGKNLFFETVMAIYGKYGRILDQDALIDKHNDWASRKLFLIADEVVAQAHRFEQKNKLKTLITGTWLRINPKHLTAYDEANHVNLVFLSNESMPVVLEEDDRRHCIIWTPPRKDPEYYRAIMAEIAAGGVEALHDYLLHLDLGEFGPADLPPETIAKDNLIQLAMDSPVEFIDELRANLLTGLTELPAPTAGWYSAYRVWCERVGARSAPLKRFVSALRDRRGIASETERYEVFGTGATRQVRFLLFGKEPPEGDMRQRWLGRCCSDFDAAFQVYRGAVDG
jgi:putative DNA primase/helicase